MDISFGLLLTVLLICLLLSSFFSSSETALMSLNRYRLRHLASTGQYSAIVTEKLLFKPDELISLILLGNNFVNIVASVCTTLISLKLGGEYAMAIGTGILTFIVLIFCEICPKTFAIQHPETIAFFAVHVLKVIKKVLKPILLVVNGITNFILWVLGANKQGNHLGLTIEQLRSVVQESSDTFPEMLHKMTLNLLELESVALQNIMTPVHEVIGLDITDTPEQILSTLRHSPYDRLPVFDESFEKIIGVVNVRETFDLQHNFSTEKLLNLTENCYFVPEKTTLASQIKLFHKHKKSIAFVIDEYGTIKGLLTLNDILEDVIGIYSSNISDALPEFEKQVDGTLLVDGGYSLRELENDHGIVLNDSNSTTVNGFILESYGDIPPPCTSLKYNNCIFEILETTENSITRVKIKNYTGEKAVMSVN